MIDSPGSLPRVLSCSHMNWPACDTEDVCLNTILLLVVCHCLPSPVLLFMLQKMYQWEDQCTKNGFWRDFMCHYSLEGVCSRRLCDFMATVPAVSSRYLKTTKFGDWERPATDQLAKEVPTDYWKLGANPIIGNRNLVLSKSIIMIPLSFSVVKFKSFPALQRCYKRLFNFTH